MKKNVVFAPLFLYNLALITHDATKSVNPSIKHGSSTPFETIKRSTVELGSARLLSTASLAVPHAVARLAFKRRAIVAPNSIHKLI